MKELQFSRIYTDPKELIEDLHKSVLIYDRSKLYVMLDLDGVILDFERDKGSYLAKYCYEFLDFLINDENIEILWSTAHFHALSPKEKFKRFKFTIVTYFAQCGFDLDEKHEILFSKLFKKAIYRPWHECKTDILQFFDDRESMRKNRNFCFVEDGLTRREIEFLDEFTNGHSDDVYFYIDLMKKETNLKTCKKFLEEKLERIKK